MKEEKEGRKGAKEGGKEGKRRKGGRKEGRKWCGHVTDDQHGKEGRVET